MNKLLLCLLFLFSLAVASAAAQAPNCPVGLVCISQTAANQAAANAREVVALRQQAEIQKQALTEKDKNVEEIKAASAKNEADLREALHKTEVDLASKTGQLTATEANVTRLTAIVDILVKQVRPKKIGLVNLF